ncbi:Adenine nucleotide alpha hydrolases-like superfamily protein, putative [Theobroma cacao]|uniref:Adenine nucleotide alpha hydrolases-like superfamily protein, putative n=1 Tax=Theobroma cacao TaxID=3641 RepID=A0A061EXY6_THECC|nr:Adenine nucleotide alpha hydrolases-like superfamily protein, putative [Theobroma cacao]
MRVMVGIDGSDASFYALQWTLDNLFNGLISPAPAVVGGEATLLTLVHVHQPIKHYGFAPSAFPAGPGVLAYASTTLVDSVRKSQEQISAGILSRALKMCKDKIKAETLILEGDPTDMICDISEQMNVDLLVVGSRGLGKIKRALLGSVSDYCAHYAKCPTLIVKPLKEASK